ncbi:trypco2 family protein [Ornithinimicrobium cerasi]|uniref:trypco2 family protein n=1 Tax=Ornithinimicrobium cerasi TaxID=2248773 RepID=UPI00137B532F|nr:trypco2 family protein [Ornithinimicrobium cerasi]
MLNLPGPERAKALDPFGRIDLADVVAYLRTELSDASTLSEDEHVQFELGPIELTLAVQVTKEATAGTEVGGKIRFWVLDADAKASASASASSQTTQTIKLTLSPVDLRNPNRDPATPVRIRGRQALGEA